MAKQSTKTLKNRSLISIGDLTKDEIEHLLKRAAEFKKKTMDYTIK